MLLAAAAFAACSDDDITRDPSPVVPDNCQNVYFSSENPTELTVSPSDLADASFDIVVSREVTANAASVPVKVIETTEAFLFANTIEFAAGASEAVLHVELNPDAASGQHRLIISADGDEYANPYKEFDGGYVLFDLTLTIEAWKYLGIAMYTDDIITGAFSVDNLTWEVEAWTRSTMEGYVCLKNVYTWNYPYNDPGDFQEEDHWFYIRIEDPDKVYIPTQYLGFDWGYGEFLVGTLAYGTLKDGVITFPVDGLGLGMRDYTNGAMGFYANSNGLFKVVLPISEEDEE